MSNLEKLHKKSITATDIASQYWCEKQMELYKLVGTKKITEEIKKGRTIHEERENEVNIKIELSPNSYSDSVFKSLYTSYRSLTELKDKHRARELQIYGSFNGYKLVGKIDELMMKGDTTLLIEDKTRKLNRVPSDAELKTHRVQVIFYRKLLNDIAKGLYTSENFKNSYHVNSMYLTEGFRDQLDSIGIKPEDQSIGMYADLLFKEYRRLSIGDSIYLRYINQFTKEIIKTLKLNYSEKEADNILRFSIKYWNGEREALPVSYDEKWKCNRCIFFGKDCKVWWPQQKLGG